MTIKDPIKIDQAKELDGIRANAKKALILLTKADYNACELINRNLLDHKQASVINTLFERALNPLRELIEYLEGLENDKG
jgi:predicted RNA methylase